MEDVEGSTAKYIAEQLEAQRVHVLIIPKEKIVSLSEAEAGRLSGITDAELTIANGKEEELPWNKLLFLSWGLVDRRGSNLHEETLDIFTSLPTRHFRIQRPDFQSIFELVRKAENVPVTEGLLAYILKEGTGRYTFSDLNSWERYNRWQLQLAAFQSGKALT